VTYVTMDLSKASSKPLIEGIMKRCHYVLHLGAFPGYLILWSEVPPGVAVHLSQEQVQSQLDFGPDRPGMAGNYFYSQMYSKETLLAKNTAGSNHMFEAAIKHRVKRVVFASTCFAYGWSHDPSDFVAKYLPIDEDSALLPNEHYGLSKQVGELQIAMQLRAGAGAGRMAESWEEGGSPSFVILRFPNSIWRGEWHNLPWQVKKTHAFGGPIMWAYVHEDDVLEGMIRSLEIPEKSLGSKCDSFNLAAPDGRLRTPTMELIDAQWAGRTLPTLKSKFCSYGGCESILSNEKASRVLGISFHARRDDYKTFKVPAGFVLQSGEVLDSEAFITYATYGTMNADKSNCILYPACFSQTHLSHEKMIGEGANYRIDSSKYFVVSVNLLGNGLSFSPTTRNGLGARFPKTTVTYHDNARLQRMLLQELGVETLAMIYGFSMGAMQALEWAVQFPDKVKGVVAVCGSAKCYPKNKEFIDSLHAALKADPHCQMDATTGRIIAFSERPVKGLSEFANIYLHWIFGPKLYKPCFKRYLLLSEVRFSWEAFQKNWVADWSSNWDAMEYYVISDTWLHGDVSSNSAYNGDIKAALGAIKAKVFLLPGSTDQYFVAEDIEKESKLIPNCVYSPLASDFGHAAEFLPWTQGKINEAIQKCLSTS